MQFGEFTVTQWFQQHCNSMWGFLQRLRRGDDQSFVYHPQNIKTNRYKFPKQSRQRREDSDDDRPSNNWYINIITDASSSLLCDDDDDNNKINFNMTRRQPCVTSNCVFCQSWTICYHLLQPTIKTDLIVWRFCRLFNGRYYVSAKYIQDTVLWFSYTFHPFTHLFRSGSKARYKTATNIIREETDTEQ